MSNISETMAIKFYALFDNRAFVHSLQTKRFSLIPVDMRTTDRENISPLESVFHCYVGRIYTLCVRLLNNVKVAEDATVAVFVRFNREPVCEWQEPRIMPRLRELAINEALARLQRLDRESEQLTSQHAPSSLSFISGRYHNSLDPITLGILIARLSDALRIVFVLHDIEKLSNAAIAARLLIDETESCRLVHAARCELRQSLFPQ